jgi:hypothetical protein
MKPNPKVRVVVVDLPPVGEGLTVQVATVAPNMMIIVVEVVVVEVDPTVIHTAGEMEAAVVTATMTVGVAEVDTIVGIAAVGDAIEIFSMSNVV